MEDNFHKNLEEFEYPAVGQTPPEMQYDAVRREIWAPDKLVESEPLWLQLVFIHAYTQRSWYLDFRRFYRMWGHFTYYKNWDLFEIIGDVKVEFHN